MDRICECRTDSESIYLTGCYTAHGHYNMFVKNKSTDANKTKENRQH